MFCQWSSGRHWQIILFCDNWVQLLFYHSITKFVFKIFKSLSESSELGAVASWLGHLSLDWAVWVQSLAGDIVLCSPSHFMLQKLGWALAWWATWFICRLYWKFREAICYLSPESVVTIIHEQTIICTQ